MDIENKKELIDKITYGRDRFIQYFNNLIGPGRTDATTLEKEIFSLENEYSDGILDQREALPIIQKIFKLNIGSLVNRGDIIYKTTTNEVVYLGSKEDVNNDGVNDKRDQDALNYIINFFQDNIDSLEKILRIAGDVDAIAEYKVRDWAKVRGLEEGSEQYNTFVDKLFNQYYLDSKDQGFRLRPEELERLVKLYDYGLGKENINDLDEYVILVRNGQAMSFIKSFLRFDMSENFNLPETQKKQAKREIINALVNVNLPEKQKLVADSIRRGRMAITGEKTTATTLLDFIEKVRSEEDLALKRVQSVANRLGLENKISSQNDEYDQFINKFYGEYYVNAKEGNSMGDITLLARVYQRLKARKQDDFNINDVDIYAHAIEFTEKKNKAFPRDLNTLMSLELSPSFGINASNRETVLKRYIDILTSNNPSLSKLKPHLNNAFRSGRIPITKEPLTVNSLEAFLNIVQNPDDYDNLIINQIANNLGFVNNPAREGDDYDLLTSKLKEYSYAISGIKPGAARISDRLVHDAGRKSQTLTIIASLYDGVDIGFDEMDILAKALLEKASITDLKYLANFYKSEKFVATNKKEKLQEYANILSSSSREVRKYFSSFLRTNRLPYSKLSSGEIKLKDLDDYLTTLQKPGGKDELIIGHLTRVAGIDPDANPTQYKEYTTKLTKWNQEDGLSISQISSLVSFDKRSENLSIENNDFDIYANGLANGARSSDLSLIYRFETSDKFGLFGSARDQKVQEYVSLLANPNTTRERKGLMISSLRANRIHILQKDLNVRNLDELINRSESEAGIFALKVDRWADSLNYTPGSLKYSNFKSTVTNLKIEDNLSDSSIARSISLLRTFPNMSPDDYKAVTKTLNANTRSSGDVASLLKFVDSDSFSPGASPAYKSLKFKEYLNIIENGSKLQKDTLRLAVRRNTINLTGKELSVTNLDQALDIVDNEDDYVLYSLDKTAKAVGINVGSGAYSNFKSLFFDDLYKLQGVEVRDLRFLAGFYSREVISKDAFGSLVQAQKQKVSSKALLNFEKFVGLSNLSSTEQAKYLNTMTGAEGGSKQRFLLQVFQNNFIPIANKKLF